MISVCCTFLCFFFFFFFFSHYGSDAIASVVDFFLFQSMWCIHKIWVVTPSIVIHVLCVSVAPHRNFLYSCKAIVCSSIVYSEVNITITTFSTYCRTVFLHFFFFLSPSRVLPLLISTCLLVSQPVILQTCILAVLGVLTCHFFSLRYPALSCIILLGVLPVVWLARLWAKPCVVTRQAISFKLVSAEE